MRYVIMLSSFLMACGNGELQKAEIGIYNNGEMQKIINAVDVYYSPQPRPEANTVQLNDFGDYVYDFMQEAFDHGTTLSLDRLIVQFNDLNSGSNASEDQVLGVCVMQEGAVPRVYIDQTEWQGLTDDTKTMLLDHELGHCMLLRAHVANANSIMYPIIRSDYQWETEQTYMLNELFTQTEYNSWKPF